MKQTSWETVIDSSIGEEVGTKPGSKQEAVLVDLCVRFGCCLPISTQLEILSRRIRTPSGLVDAVVVAEGLDPADPNRPAMIEHAERVFRSPTWSNTT